MLELLEFPSFSTLIVALGAVATCMIYYYAKVKDSKQKGKALPQVCGYQPRIDFYYRAQDNDLHGWAVHWAQKYGDIFKMNVFVGDMVFINSSELVRRILNDPEYKEYSNDRPYTFIGRYGFYGDHNITFNSSSPIHQQRRRSFHSTLKFYGDGVGSAESIILRILNDEVEKFKNQSVLEMSKDISRIILRIMDHLFIGDKPEGSEYRVKCLYEFNSAFTEITSYGNEALVRSFPFLRFVPGRYRGLYCRFMEARTNLENIYYSRRDSLIVDEDGGLLGQILKLQKKLAPHVFPEETIKSLLLEATIGGFLTTSSMLNTVFLLFIVYPEMQQRLYEEIERVIGDETPCLRRHRNKMPITESFLLETLRYTSSVPLLVMHALSKDINLEGYHVPKGAMLIINAWYCQRNPSFWDDPWTFKADRFLNENGDLVSANHPFRLNVIQFGTGRRSCPGETFAKSRMFLFIVTLLQNFRFSKAPGCELPDLDPRKWKPGPITRSNPYKCAIHPRKKILPTN